VLVVADDASGWKLERRVTVARLLPRSLRGAAALRFDGAIYCVELLGRPLIRFDLFTRPAAVVLGVWCVATAVVALSSRWTSR
jgi:uncharacterized membrane protein YphA (DoxX/SURF4 family)